MDNSSSYSFLCHVKLGKITLEKMLVEVNFGLLSKYLLFLDCAFMFFCAQLIYIRDIDTGVFLEPDKSLTVLNAKIFFYSNSFLARYFWVLCNSFCLLFSTKQCHLLLLVTEARLPADSLCAGHPRAPSLSNLFCLLLLFLPQLCQPDGPSLWRLLPIPSLV